jgi:hypothetical protein
MKGERGAEDGEMGRMTVTVIRRWRMGIKSTRLVRVFTCRPTTHDFRPDSRHTHLQNSSISFFLSLIKTTPSGPSQIPFELGETQNEACPACWATNAWKNARISYCVAVRDENAVRLAYLPGCSTPVELAPFCCGVVLLSLTGGFAKVSRCCLFVTHQNLRI